MAAFCRQPAILKDVEGRRPACPRRVVRIGARAVIFMVTSSGPALQRDVGRREAEGAVRGEANGGWRAQGRLGEERPPLAASWIKR